MATSRRFVSSHPTSSTSSMSEDYFSDDDDSIGPLPVLKRNVSFTRRNHESEVQVKVSKTARDTISLSLQQQSLPNSSSKDERDKRRNLPALPRPRRVQSLHLPGNTKHPCDNLLERRASMQPGAASRSSQSRRPDPPEQIRPVPSLTSPHEIMVFDHSLSKPVDQQYTQIEPPKKTVRALSMPLSARNSDTLARPKSSAKSQKRQPAVKNDDLFLARRSKSIARSFPRPNSIDHDVWVERMVVREGKSPQVFFKSVFSKECKIQPPTGAVNVIYMDELVKVYNQDDGKPQEQAVVAPVKKQSFWGKAKKDLSISKETSKSRSTPLGKLKSALFLRVNTQKSH